MACSTPVSWREKHDIPTRSYVLSVLLLTFVLCKSKKTALFPISYKPLFKSAFSSNLQPFHSNKDHLYLNEVFMQCAEQWVKKGGQKFRYHCTYTFDFFLTFMFSLLYLSNEYDFRLSMLDWLPLCNLKYIITTNLKYFSFYIIFFVVFLSLLSFIWSAIEDTDNLTHSTNNAFIC